MPRHAPACPTLRGLEPCTCTRTTIKPLTLGAAVRVRAGTGRFAGLHGTVAQIIPCAEEPLFLVIFPPGSAGSHFTRVELDA